ncbi:coth protein-domain-containing protein [Phascolomyces articulosus]|uniref:Coth protein-domain-containing protein n=1 Tax=Phascolomyces articulosus TaxID=60185 RepID=A0AAD5K7E8_9FUNG|nr:coth protein-domain-containing protein [Phascolomyces articulosus]
MALRFLYITTTALLLLNSAVNAQQDEIQYQVISMINQPDTSMVVMVDDQQYPLTQSSESRIVYTGSAPVAQSGYQYAKANGNSILEHEPFTRQPVESDTIYEFYNRSHNSWEIPSVPSLYDPLYNRIDTELHLEGQMGTIHIYGNASGMDHMHANILDDITVITNMTYIRGNDLITFQNTEIELAGQSSKWIPKLSYNVKISKDDDSDLYGYRRLKIRALGMDPSYIRENMVYKALHAAGVATSQFSYVRVFIDDHQVGLFGLIEQYKNPWLRNEFDNGNKDYQQGNLYQARAGSDIIPGYESDLGYIGENETLYGAGQYKIKEDPSEGEPSFRPIMDLTRFLANGSSHDVSEWEKHFDMEALLRSLAMEILLGFSDGYFTLANNFYLYQNGLDSEQFVFIPADVDTTLGLTIVKMADMLSGNYSTFPGFNMRPLMPQLLQVPELKERYEHLIQQLSLHVVTPDVFDSVIDATVNMIRQDVEWDMRLPKLSTFDWSTVPPFDFGPEGAMYPLDNETITDAMSRTEPITFDMAVNGPTGSISLAGVKEYIARSNKAIKSFYNL